MFNGTLMYAKASRSVETGVPNMAYQLKDQDVTPPQVGAADKRSVAADGLAAVAILLTTIGLITLVILQVVR